MKLTPAALTALEADLKTALPPLTPAQIQAILQALEALLPILLALLK